VRKSPKTKTILISGKVASDNIRSANVDIFLVLDTSGSTVLSAGAEFATGNYR
jgi:hypothetical protein